MALEVELSLIWHWVEPSNCTQNGGFTLNWARFPKFCYFCRNFAIGGLPKYRNIIFRQKWQCTKCLIIQEVGSALFVQTSEDMSDIPERQLFYAYGPSTIPFEASFVFYYAAAHAYFICIKHFIISGLKNTCSKSYVDSSKAGLVN